MTVLETILSNTYTTVDLNRRLARAREFVEYFVYRQTDDKESIIKNSALIDELELFLERKGEKERDVTAICEWGESAWTTLATKDPSEQFKNLSRLIENLPIIDLYLPHKLPDEALDAIGEQFREKFGRYVILDVRISSKMIGGCAFSFQGHYYDYSFQKRAESHHAEITEMVKNIGRDQAVAE
ncbi:MAG: F0F1 ATP synthase subunit delta [Candidatus Paceibacterota bacterium]